MMTAFIGERIQSNVHEEGTHLNVPEIVPIACVERLHQPLFHTQSFQEILQLTNE